MVEIVDGFGRWDDLGTVEPQFETWLGFQDYTRSKSSTLRLYYTASEYDRLSYGFIRCLYQSTNAYFIGQWIRVYPKPFTDTILYPHPQDLLANNDELILIYQIQKRHRYRRYVGMKYSTLWSVNLQVFIASKENDSQQEQIIAGYPTAYFLGLL